ncbi:MFS transporter [Micromonospora sp. WMMD987]|uniref:MFS transporter n=1 Tax=Micromonospora sp. WMMD987 TaxID=3016089 RepID=UPI0032B5DBD5
MCGREAIELACPCHAHSRISGSLEGYMSPDAILTKSEAEPGAAPRGHRTGIALAIIVSCQLILTIDLMIVTVALPSIGADLGFSETGMAWVVNVYGLALGGLMLLGGRMGDIFGRRRIFMTGIALFTVASLLGGFATADWWFLGARALQGVGAAMAMPTTLALILSLFPEGAGRTKAIATSAAASSSGAVVGLLLGGVLATGLSWRWVMFVNVPVGILVFLLTPVFIAEQARMRGRFDVAGAVTSALSVVLLVYGLSNAGHDGWSNWTTVVGPIIGGAVLFAVFIAVESRARQPIMPLRLFSDRNRVTAYLSAVLVTGSMIGMSFFLTMFVQGPLGFSPLIAGVSFLTTGFALVFTSVAVTAVLPRIGERWMTFLGALALVVGYLWLADISLDSGYWGAIFGPLVLVGAGMAATLIPATEMAGAGVTSHNYGAASSTYNTMLQLGGPFVLAVLVTVYGTASRTATGNAPAGLTPEARDHYVLTESMSPGFVAAAIVAAVVAVTSLFIRSTRRGEQPAGAVAAD